MTILILTFSPKPKISADYTKPVCLNFRLFQRNCNLLYSVLSVFTIIGYCHGKGCFDSEKNI